MRILVELPTWLGDTVMTTPAIENLVNFHNDSEVVLIGSSTSIEIFKNHPHVSQTRALDKTYLSLFNLARKLDKFDKFFSFNSSDQFFKVSFRFLDVNQGLNKLASFNFITSREFHLGNVFTFFSLKFS